MRVVFMGTPDFAVPSLKALVEAGYQVQLVVTQPDRPKGRGKKTTFSPVKEYAIRQCLPVLQPEQVRGEEFLTQLSNYNPDVVVVVAYGRILPAKVLSLPKLGCINVHASLLPAYRGAAPIHRAIINGEELTGITTMYMDEGLDTGDMILKQEMPIDRKDTVGDLHDRLAAIGADLLVETLGLIANDCAPRTPQTGVSSYAPILTNQDELIDWRKPAVEIFNQIRGLNPWPGARTYLEGKVLKIWGSEVLHEEHSPTPPGRVFDVRREGLLVSTGKNVLLITELQFQGAKRLLAADYLRGNKAPVGKTLELEGENN
ncbi:MAG: methionyl-tRNA formyltransferase [Peptococcaceae bacterium]|nr:methionyl-tRNA formyltransferase [Peptococcaceae bacterium]